jgi:hypothetical protein
MKPTPVAVNVKAELPDGIDDGEIEVRLSVCAFPVMASCIAVEVVVSDFITLTLTVPATAICAADTTVVSSVFETNVVGWATPSHKICVPLV